MTRNICILVLLMLPLAALLTGCGTKTIDATDYARIKMHEWEGKTNGYCYVDYEQLVGDHLDAFGIKSEDADAVDAAVADTAMRLHVTAEDTEDLKNGDVVMIQWRFEDTEDFREKYHIAFSFQNRQKYQLQSDTDESGYAIMQLIPIE